LSEGNACCEDSKTCAPASTETNNLKAFTDKEYKKKDQRWIATFEKLKQYREMHGNLIIPSKDRETKRLNDWMRERRREYRELNASPGLENSNLTQDRIDALKAIGFDFDPKVKNRFDVIWNNRLQELRQYKEEHGCFPSGSSNNKGLFSLL